MVSSSSSVETRDTSIQILDNFLAQLDFQTRCEPLSHTDTSIISLAAASAVILSTKLHEIRPLCTVRVYLASTLDSLPPPQIHETYSQDADCLNIAV